MPANHMIASFYKSRASGKLLFVAFFWLLAQQTLGQQKLKRIKSTKGLVAVWDFSEGAGIPRQAESNMGAFSLQEKNGTIERVAGGPLSGFAARFTGNSYLSLDSSLTGKLNIYGRGASVTVMAWVKWEGKGGFVAGLWNETAGGGKRQYGLFVNLPYYNGDSAVCGHISFTGKPTMPFLFSTDYSASPQIVPVGIWTCIAFTYDGTYIRSFLNGAFEARQPELIKNTKGFPGYPNGAFQSKNPYFFTDGIGNNASDFTVGAVELKRGMGNFFIGEIGGVAVFSRALKASEIKKLTELP